MTSTLRFLHKGVLIVALSLIVNNLSLMGQDNEAEARRLYRIGTVAVADNDFEIAARNFKRAAELAPRNGQIRLSLAIVQNKLGQIGDARESVKAALTLGLDGKDRDQAEQLEAELDYKIEKRGGTGSEIAAILSNLSSTGSVDGASGNCKVTYTYSNPRVSGCDISYSYKKVFNGACFSDSEIQDVRFSLSNSVRVSIEELAGFWGNTAGRYTVNGVTNVVVRTIVPATVVARNTQNGTSKQYQDGELYFVFGSQSEGQRMMNLLQSYSKICKGSQSEEISRQASEAQRQAEAKAEQIRRKKAALAPFVGNWAFSEIKDSSDDVCSYRDMAFQRVFLSENGVELSGVVDISGSYFAGHRWILLNAPKCGNTYQNKFTKKGTWRVWFDEAANRVRISVQLTCRGDGCDEEKASYTGILKMVNGKMVRVIDDKDIETTFQRQ
ncbi:MAG TPA: tetratricopeptide repeat protein [Blastocatellia bacterium]|nr:tetratricopeptide repeat protein [Blastocatellia bacterium]